MSIKAIAWAIEQDIHPRDKLVLIILANYANDKNYAWPSVKTVMKNTGLKRSAIFEALNSLEAVGIITRTARTRKTDGRQTSSTIRLNVQVLFIPPGDPDKSPASGPSPVQHMDPPGPASGPQEPSYEPSIKNPTSASASGGQEDMKKHGEKGVEETLLSTPGSSTYLFNTLNNAEKKHGKYSVPTLRKVWAALYAYHEWGFLSEWTMKQQGQMRMLQTKLKPLDMVEVLKIIIPNWNDFCKTTNWSKTPPAPQIGFMMTQSDVVGTMVQEALQATAKPAKDEKPPMKYKFVLPKAVDLTNATGTGDNKANDNASEDE